MPRIPTYQQQTTPGATLNVGPVETGAAGVARGAASLAAGVASAARSFANADYVLRAKEDSDAVSATNLEISKGEQKFDDWTIEAQQARAGNPDGFTEDGLKAFDEYSSQVIGSAKTPRARQYAEQQMAQMRARLFGQWKQWEANKGIEIRANNWAQATDLDRKILQTDPSRFDEIVERQGKALAESRLPSDVRDKMWTNFKERAAADAVEGMIRKAPGKTLQMLKADPEKAGNSAIAGLSPEARNKFIDMADAEIKRQTDNSMANFLVGTVRSTVQSMPVGPGDMIDLAGAKARAVAAARARYGNLDAEQILRIENYTESAARDVEQNIRRGRESAKASAFDALDQNGGDVEALKVTQPDLFRSLDREGQDAVNRYGGVVSTGGTRTTDWKTYNELVNDPRLLVQTNLDAIRDRFNVRELAHLKTLQEQLISQPETEDNVRDTGTLLKERLAEAGIGKKDDEAQGRFYSLLQASVNEELAATGKKKLTQARTLELADDLLVRSVTSRGTFWDSTGPAFTIEVPEVERQKITLSLMAAGMPVNELSIMRAYRAKLNKAPQ